MFGLSNEVIKDISDVLKKHPNIDKVLIFGSRAKGNYTRILKPPLQVGWGYSESLFVVEAGKGVEKWLFLSN